MTAPGGFIGKLCVHKSGKVVLVLDDKQFDVAPAQTPAFYEEVSYYVNANTYCKKVICNLILYVLYII
jgi:DNA-directed RNA polymerase III subunit RPC4